MEEMGIVGHGAIIIYTIQGDIIYSNTCDENVYMDIIKNSDAMKKLDEKYIHIKEWCGYSIFLDNIELAGGIYNIAHIMPKQNNIEYYRHLAYRDCLTGLYNRNFWEHIKAGLVDIIDYDYYTIILLDMDNLKDINDEIGHRSRDCAIKKVSKAIQSSIRDTDIAIRCGGDEFIVIVPGLGGRKVAEKIVYRIKAKVARINITDDMQLSISAGYASGRGLESIEKTSDLADYEMLKEKRNKKGLLHMMGTTELEAIKEYIEDARERLNDLIIESLGEELDSDTLLKVSRELDELINIYMDMLNKSDVDKS